mmetsp:Transcript_1039/g.3512  ORF Transcript_1039/g.3512 Transcript_1039/m.3512 type:complete len:143 (+) Transcript_1039:59-487(+)
MASGCKPLKLIGMGAYGVVCSALDRKTGKEMAIKKIQKAFDIPTIAKRTLLEIKLLRHFQKHDNIITIEGILQLPPLPTPFNDVYVMMELLESAVSPSLPLLCGPNSGDGDCCTGRGLDKGRALCAALVLGNCMNWSNASVY